MIAENRIDFIGEIHGHADELEDLLHKLGYSKLNGSYKHPDRTAFLWEIILILIRKFLKR